jgi:hypothetical protein
MQMSISQTEKEDLVLYKDAILHPNRNFTKLELDALYNLSNRIYGTTKVPNGCGACLRGTLQGLKRALIHIEGI